MNNTLQLIKASREGNTEEVARLIPISDPLHNNCAALQGACWHEHYACVQLLIPVSDPKVCSSVMLRLAVDVNDHVLVDMLYNVSDPQEALQWMNNNEPKRARDQVWVDFAYRVSCVEENKELSQMLNNSGCPTRKKLI